jgi:hypothetical protein
VDNINRPGLTYQDIAIILDIINVASGRNAFRIEEYATVGDVFQKLTSIIQAAGAEKSTPAVCSTPEETKND